MIEKIGKYRIIERIGRGGMGTVYKAHDPMLDRLVALKVISSEGEVTDELKARFYREAQACARLNHPNIVVVHDLGEDGGRLFIVMEFLDGEELKHLISQRQNVPIEDKLALMIQVCDGLNYAHQNGVIHRDIKPGNIFVLRNGQVKILDFGIARIAAADTGLTRTGFIMGTLRYMSPEQARGRVDHRSDQFSAGAVFYELLTYRPAFDSDDPMETLEKLRTEDPPPLTEVDPSIPPDVAAAVEKAMRKDPNQRFPDLGQMRVKLEQVRRRMTDEAERLQAHVRAQLEQLTELRRRLAGSGSGSVEDETVPVVDERMRTGDLRALERQLAEQIERLRADVERAGSVQPAVGRGLELLEQGDFAGAIAAFEGVLREVPEQGQAEDGLRRARARQEEVGRLLAEARGAREQHADGRCLELLDQLAAASAAAAAAPAAVQLRQAAQEGQRARAAAEQARERVRQARSAAEQAEAPRDAATAWADAEAKTTEGDRALEQHADRQAEARYQEAAQAYERAAAAARQAAETLSGARTQAETASHEATEARQAAAQLNAASYAEPKWTAAQAKEASGQKALGGQDYAAARTLFGDAQRLYREAAHDARVAAEAEAQRRASQAEAERVRQAVAAARQAAEEAGAPQFAAAAFAKAEAAERGGSEALGRQAFADALSRFHGAEQAYQEAAQQAVEARRVARARVEEATRAAAQAKEAAAALDPPTYAPSKWAAAQVKESAGQTALGREDYPTAQSLLAEAGRLYEEAAREARTAAEAEARRKAEQAEALRLRQAAAVARRAAREARAAEAAAAAFAEGQAAEQAGETALGREAFADAQARFRAAEQAYQQAARQAPEERAVRAAVADAQRLIREGRPDRAMDALARVRAAAPSHPELVKLETQAQQAIEARKLRDRVRELLDTARKLTARGEIAKALEVADEAVHLVPDDAAALRFRDDLQEALKASHASRPTSTATTQTAATEARRKAEAEAEARRKAEQAEAEAEARRKAEAEARGKAEWEQAVRAALVDAPRLIREGRPDRALEALARARTVDPTNAELARLETQARHLLDARKTRERVTSLLDRADQLQGRGELAQALEAAQQAASLAPDDAAVVRLRDDLQERLRKPPAPPRTAAPAARAAASAPAEAAPRPGPARGLGRAKLGIGAGVLVVMAIIVAYTMRPPTTETPKEIPKEVPKETPKEVPKEAPTQPSQPPGRARAEELRQRMAASRDEARKVEAEGLVPELWRAAAEREREAEMALGKQDFAGAQQGYTEAQQRYAAAAAGARQKIIELTETAKVRPLQEQAAQAQRLAKLADAPTLSGSLWVKATGLEQSANDALQRRDYPKAQALFRDAEQAYKAAESEASQKKSKEEQQKLEARKRDLQATEKLAASTDDARRKAEEANAARYAAKVYALAVGKQKEAQDALGKEDYSGAQRRFREANDEYERARQEATKAAALEKKDQELRAQQQRSAEQARTLMTQARAQAEGADAKRYATKLWQDAQAKESAGQAALAGNQYTAALQNFKDAQQEYDQARTEALRAAEQEKKEQERLALRQGAEQARTLMAQARTQAEGADAKRYAAKLWQDAQARESDAQAAFGRQDWAGAQQRFKDAQQEYDRARTEAARASEVEKQRQLALVKQQSEEMARARQQATTARGQAQGTEADKLARDLFDAARAKENEADGQATRQAYAAATTAYQDATRRYGEAAARAGTLRQERAEADQVKSRMLAEKQKARSDAAEFKAAVAAEQQGDQTYQRLAFKEATGFYGTAQGLFAKAATPAPTPPRPIDPRTEIRAVLDSYKKAIEGKNVALFEQVRPNLSEAELRRVRASFEQSKSQTVDLKIESIEIKGDEAEAKGRRMDVFVPKEGREVRNEAPFVFKLKRTASGWVIEAVN